MRRSYFAFCFWVLLLVAGCGNSNSDYVMTPPSQPGPSTGTIRVQQVLLRAVPSEVTRQRFTGFDNQGEVRFGLTRR